MKVRYFLTYLFLVFFSILVSCGKQDPEVPRIFVQTHAMIVGSSHLISPQVVLKSYQIEIKGCTVSESSFVNIMVSLDQASTGVLNLKEGDEGCEFGITRVGLDYGLGIQQFLPLDDVGLVFVNAGDSKVFKEPVSGFEILTTVVSAPSSTPLASQVLAFSILPLKTTSNPLLGAIASSTLLVPESSYELNNMRLVSLIDQGIVDGSNRRSIGITLRCLLPMVHYLCAGTNILDYRIYLVPPQQELMPIIPFLNMLSSSSTEFRPTLLHYWLNGLKFSGILNQETLPSEFWLVLRQEEAARIFKIPSSKLSQH